VKAAVVLLVLATTNVTAEVVPRQAQSTPIFTYHSGFWLNLHQFLYVLGRVEAKMADINRSAVAGAPGDEAQGLARLNEDERRIWREVVAAYANGPSRQDAVFDNELVATGQALARAGNATMLAGAGVAPQFADNLERAAPIYRKAWWDMHERANKNRERQLDALVLRHGQEVLSFITRAYQEAWPSDGYPVQFVAWANWAGAFSTGERHLVVSTLDAGSSEASGLETLFHEAMHQWDRAMQRRINVTADRLQKRVTGPVSHAMVFYTAGEAIRRVIPGHQPAADTFGIWRSQMGRFKPALDAAWKPYLDGKGTLDEALIGVVATMP
jgi:hypothetical protein